MGVDRFFRKSIIGSGSVNLNDYKTTGSILVNGATEILNAPSGTTPYFELFVIVGRQFGHPVSPTSVRCISLEGIGVEF